VFEQEPSVSVSTARFMSGCPNPEMDPVLTRPDSGTEAAVQTDHMIGVSDTFADMADAVLVLENTEVQQTPDQLQTGMSPAAPVSKPIDCTLQEGGPHNVKPQTSLELVQF